MIRAIHCRPASAGASDAVRIDSPHWHAQVVTEIASSRNRIRDIATSVGGIIARVHREPGASLTAKPVSTNLLASHGDIRTFANW